MPPGAALDASAATNVGMPRIASTSAAIVAALSAIVAALPAIAVAFSATAAAFSATMAPRVREPEPGQALARASARLRAPAPQPARGRHVLRRARGPRNRTRARASATSLTVAARTSASPRSCPGACALAALPRVVAIRRRARGSGGAAWRHFGDVVAGEVEEKIGGGTAATRARARGRTGRCPSKLLTTSLPAAFS